MFWFHNHKSLRICLSQVQHACEKTQAHEPARAGFDRCPCSPFIQKISTMKFWLAEYKQENLKQIFTDF